MNLEDHLKIESKDINILIDSIQNPSNKMETQLRDIYGEDQEFIRNRKNTYLNTLSYFKKIFNEGKVILIRTPARINLMGVHIEHRGGYTNYLSIGKEIIAAAERRDDDLVIIHNVDKKYTPRKFSIQEEMPPEKRGNWIKFIKEAKIIPGDWSNYVRAAVFVLQNKFPRINLKGINIVFNGNIPPSAGLSSSSAMVVTTALAILNLNKLYISREESVKLCGEGEWYVGTRGGWGDHAAMIYGEKNYISHLKFFPFEIDFIPFPSGFRVISCNSLVEASKSAGAKSIFNERVASYEIALMLIKRNFPSLKEIKYLRDINSDYLGEREDFIYRILKTLPEKITRKELLRELPDYENKLNELFKTHKEPTDGYKVRSVCLFGLAECERSKICVELLQNSEMEKFGELMYISHDGDRIVSYNKEGGKNLWNNSADDEKLNKLIENAGSKDSKRVMEAHLYRQPGGYSCSCEKLDFIVDTARRIKGVVGAGLTGGGLGGCVLILVKEGKVKEIIKKIIRKYYYPRNLESAIDICIPIEGAGILR